MRPASINDSHREGWSVAACAGARIDRRVSAARRQAPVPRAPIAACVAARAVAGSLTAADGSSQGQIAAASTPVQGRVPV